MVIGLIVLNIYFIPLSLAFRWKYGVGMFSLEFATILVYALDIYFRTQNYKSMQMSIVSV
jgi:hypothetical protein